MRLSDRIDALAVSLDRQAGEGLGYNPVQLAQTATVLWALAEDALVLEARVPPPGAPDTRARDEAIMAGIVADLAAIRRSA